jgi:hypothetical protein
MQSQAWKIDLPFTRGDWLFFASVALAFLAIDVAMIRIEDELLEPTVPSWRVAEWVNGFAMAILIAQIVVLAIWATLFDGSNLLRVLIAMLVLCVAFYFLVAVTSASVNSNYLREWAAPFALPMIVVLYFAAQVPFWLLRFFLGWRIRRTGDAGYNEATPRRFQMLHMLGWAAFLSVPLAMSREYHGGNLFYVAIPVASLLTGPVILAVLFTWATLGSKSLGKGLAVGIPIGIGLTAIGALGYLAVYPRAARLMPGAALLVLAAVSIIYVGTGIATRAFGYRLYARRARVPQ